LQIMPPQKDPRPLTAKDVLERYNDCGFPDFCDPLTDINQVGTFGNRPLHMAAYHGNMEEIEALVAGGAQVNVVGDMGSTPLHEAVEKGHSEAVRFLLENGARTDVRNEFGRTALDIAKLEGRSDLIDLLSRYGEHKPD
jgi:ankyrin repeat protein